MADSPEVRRGTGGDPTSPPLEQGEATAVNEALEEIPEEDELLPDETTTGALSVLSSRGMFASQAPQTEGGYVPKNEQEAVLFAPGEATSEQFLDANRQRAKPIPPRNIGSWLPALAAASRDPSAPPGVRALFETIIDALYPPTA